MSVIATVIYAMSNASNEHAVTQFLAIEATKFQSTKNCFCAIFASSFCVDIFVCMSIFCFVNLAVRQ